MNKKIGIALLALLIPVIASATTLRVVQTPTLHLYTGQSASATTMRVTPYPKDLDGTKLTIGDLGTLPTVTVDPKISGIEEIEAFTAITDNGDGTATLTGVSRNLVSKYPYTTTGTGRAHGAGATVVFGNNPQIYGRLWAPENQATSTAILYFTSTFMPRYDVDPGAAAFTLAPDSVLVNMAQLTRTAMVGASNATRALQGLVQIASRGQAASSTQLGSTGAFLVLPADIATSSPSISMATSSIVMTQLDGRISALFISTSSVYTFGGISVNTTSTFIGTTTIAASNASTTALVLNTVAYQMPSSRGASSTVLSENGYGHLSWQTPDWYLCAATTTTGSAIATTTLSGIPAATDLHIVVEAPVFGGNWALNMQFNGDTAGNYAWNKLTQGSTNLSGSSVSVITLTQTETTYGFASQISVTNTAAKNKLVYAQTTEAAAASNVSGDTVYGVWANTSNQINSVSIGCGATACPVGTRTAVYCSHI